MTPGPTASILVAALLAATPALCAGFQDTASEAAANRRANETSRQDLARAEWNDSYFSCLAAQPSNREWSDRRAYREEPGVTVEKVAMTNLQDRKGARVRVTGELRNTLDRNVPAPLLALTALDDDGAPIATRLARSDRRIARGETTPFAMDLRKADHAARVVVMVVVDPLSTGALGCSSTRW